MLAINSHDKNHYKNVCLAQGVQTLVDGGLIW